MNWYLDINHDAGDPFPSLIDNLCLESGLRSAKFLIASTELEDCTFEKLRRCGFCPFSWQKIWRFDGASISQSDDFRSLWEPPTPEETFEIIRTQKKLMAPAVQAITKNLDRNPPELVCKENGTILGFASSKSFGGKVVVTPLFQPVGDHSLETLKSLVQLYLDDFREVYVRQNSDISWLSPFFEAAAVPVTPRLEMLVKHLAVQQKAAVLETSRSRNGRQTDTITPFLQSGGKKD